MAALTAQTITIYRGEQVTIPFAFAPVENITGHTLLFTVTAAVDKPTKKIGPLAVSVVSAAVGTFNVILTEELTNLKAGTYVWDVWRADEGLEEVKAIGPFVVLGNSRVPPTG